LKKASVGIVQAGSDLKFIKVNEAYCKMLGYKEEELIGKSFSIFTHPDDVKMSRNIGNKLFGKDGHPIQFEKRYITKDKKTIWCRLSLSILDSINGVPQSTITIVEDITERKEAEIQLEKLSGAIEKTADHIIITDKNGIIEYVNPAFEELTGFKKEIVIGKTPRVLKSGIHSVEFYNNLWKTILAGKVFRSVMVNKKKSGELYYEEKTITPLKDPSGNVTHFLSTGKDITEKKKIEEELRISEESFRTIFEQVPIGIVLTDKNSILVRVNDKFCKMLGYSNEELLGKHVKDLTYDEDVANSLDFQSKLLTGKLEYFSFSKRYVKKNKEILWANITASTLCDEDGNMKYGLGIIEDISERILAQKKREEAVKLTEKAAHLTSLGTMAAGISHEINQPLTALKIKVDGMLYWQESDKFLEKEFDKKMFQDHLEFVSEQTSRIDNIVKQIRSLAVKDRDSKTVSIDVNKVILDALSMMRQQMSARGIKINLQLDKGIPTFEGQMTSLQQVIINLVSNARDALNLSKKKKKEIEIRTEKDIDNIIIVIRDNGPGVDNENIDRLFEPFFTTKNVVEGMGLGLSIVQSSVNAMGGSVSVENHEKGGACFTILLPINM